jgi:acyl carrier protein
MNIQPIGPAVLRVVAKFVSLPEIELSMDDNLAGKLGLDSLDMIELMMDVEDEFGVTFIEREIQSANTIRDIADLVTKAREAV